MYTQTVYTQTKERGGCLTAWLVVSGLASFTALCAWTSLLTTPRLLERVPILAVILLFVLIAANFAGVLGTWNWKRWGVYLLVATSFVSPVLETLLGIAQPSDYVAVIVQMVILYVFVQSRWRDFE